MKQPDSDPNLVRVIGCAPGTYFLAPLSLRGTKHWVLGSQRLSVVIHAAVSDFLYLPPIVGKLFFMIGLGSSVVACKARKTSAFDSRTRK